MGYVVTPKFRVSFPNIFKARLNKLNGKEEFGCVALFAKGENLKALEAEVLRAIKEKWGTNAVVNKTPQGTYALTVPGKGSHAFRMPFRDQGERDKGEGQGLPQGYEEGAKFINLKSNQKPGLVDQKNQEIMQETDFYAGCYAKAAVNAYGYDQQGNKGVAFGLQAIQKVADGEPLGNRVRPQDAFQPIEVAEDESADSVFN